MAYHVAITGWSPYSSPPLLFYSLLHIWLHRLISSNEIISRWSQTTFSGSNTFFRPDLHFLHAPCSVATVMLSPHTVISHRPSCDPALSSFSLLYLSLSYVMTLSLSLAGALMHIFILYSFFFFFFPFWTSSLIPLYSSLPVKARLFVLENTWDTFYLSVLHHVSQAVTRTLVFLFLSNLHRSTKTHPGPVVHISDNPMDEGKVTDSWPRYVLWNKVTFLHFFSIKTNCTVLCALSSSLWRTAPVQMAQCQYGLCRLIAEHLQLIKISMIHIRIWRENQRENVSSQTKGLHSVTQTVSWQRRWRHWLSSCCNSGIIRPECIGYECRMNTYLCPYITLWLNATGWSCLQEGFVFVICLFSVIFTSAVQQLL